MKLAVVGFGNAGSKIADRLLDYERETGRNLSESVTAINSARTDLAKPMHIPEENRYLIGQTNPRAKGHGVGGDPDLGAEIVRRDRKELDRAMDDVPVYEIDAFLVIAGLGGGTGSGGAPVLAERLKDLYEEPVYGFGVLPSEDEGGRPALNAARSFRMFVEATDNLILFDNSLWSQGGDTIETAYDHMNEEIAKRIGTLLSAGELDGSIVSENAMDSSDIRRTLATGGVSTIAYAEAELNQETRRQRGLLGRFQRNGKTDHEDADISTKVDGLIRQAVRSRLTCPGDIRSADRSLIVISGPPQELSQKGIESARQWIERETGSTEVLAGDDPREDARCLSAVVIFSNVTDIPRINQLQDQAVAAKETFEKQENQRERDIENLIVDEGNKLDPI